MPAIPVLGEEFIDDTPVFRDRVKETRGSLDDLSKSLSKINKALGHINHLTKEIHKHQEIVLGEITSFIGSTKYDPPQSLLKSALEKIVEALRGIEANRELTVIHMHELLTATIQSFQQQKLSPIQELGKQEGIARESFLNASLKYMAKLSGKDGMENIEEAANAVSSSRREHLSKSRTYANALNQAQLCRNFELVESFIASIYSRNSFFQNAAREFVTLEPVLADISLHISALRGEGIDLESKIAEQRELQLDSLHSHSPVDLEMESLAVSRLKLKFSAPVTGSSGNISSAGKKGYLFRRYEGTLRATWRREYFSIKNHMLHAIPDEASGSASASNLSLSSTRDEYSIDLRICSVRPHEMAKKQAMFCISMPHSSFILQARNESEMEAWVSALKVAIAKAFSNDTDSPIVGAIEFPPGSQSSSNHAEASLSLSMASKSLLSDLVKIPGNEKCADCGSSDQLDWASSNIGVIVCIQCSGVHRGLGSHISRIKSLSLDDWTLPGIELMSRLGNTRVNAILEQSLAENNLAHIVKPSETSSPSERTLFVQSKYEHRDYTGDMDVKTGLSRKPSVPELVQFIQSSDLAGILKCLLQGVQLRSAEDGQVHPLQAALMARDIPAMELLLQWKADINLVEYESGWTCLHHAISKGDVELVSYLLTKNANLSIQDKKLRTPLDLAVELAYKHQGEDSVKIVTLLQLNRFNKDQGMPLSRTSSRNFGSSDDVGLNDYQHYAVSISRGDSWGAESSTPSTKTSRTDLADQGDKK